MILFIFGGYMPYYSPLEKRHAVLELFATDNIPRTILEIARGMGYKKSTPLRVALHNLHHEGSLVRREEVRPNGQTRFIYLMTEKGKTEYIALSKLLRKQKLENFFDDIL